MALIGNKGLSCNDTTIFGANSVSTSSRNLDDYAICGKYRPQNSLLVNLLHFLHGEGNSVCGFLQGFYFWQGQDSAFTRF